MQLVIDDISKSYGRARQALRNVSLRLSSGVIGMLGPNGAGKSTLMRILATVTRPSSGRVLWDGEDIGAHPGRLRSVLGYLPQDFGIYPNLNAWEFLDYLAAVKGIPGVAAHKRIAELLELVNLANAAKRPLGSYSGGMRQRVGIAQALLNDPQLLIVDEPTAGLDPEERVRFRNLLSELSGERIVILSTHIVSDIEAIATELAILSHGRLLTHAVPEKLLEEARGRVWEMVVAAADLPEVRVQHRISNVAHRSDGVHVRVFAESSPSPSAQRVDPSLEDAYFAVLRRNHVAEFTAPEVAR